MRFRDLGRLVTRPSRMRPVLAVPLVLAVAGCMSGGGGGGGSGVGSTLTNLVKYGSLTEPPIPAQPQMEAADCPNVQVAEGRSAIRQGEGAAVRSQLSIANVARECVERENGAVVVKVGVEGRALLGPGGASSRFDVPLYFAIRRGDQVLASRVQRVAVVIPPGSDQASFLAVQGDLVVPPGTGEFDIEVGLGSDKPIVTRGGSVSGNSLIPKMEPSPRAPRGGFRTTR